MDSISATQVVRLLQLLEHEQRHLEELSAAIAGWGEQLDGRDRSPADGERFSVLLLEATRLNRERQRLRRELQPWLRSSVAGWGALPLSVGDRQQVVERCGRLRATAGRTVGLLRATMRAARIWSAVLESALAALVGVESPLTTYTARGTSVGSRPAVCLEVRS